jgi:NAD(P)-dependent dehydrogenase (short-subunit alcohol dehydrogenase family)
VSFRSELDGPICVVAGGGNGLGRAAAHELAGHGVSVVVNDLGTVVDGTGSDPAAAESAAGAIRAEGGIATTHHGDVRDFGYAERLIADAASEHGRLDFVRNFAGILRDGVAHEVAEDDWRAVIETNLTGQLAPLRAAAAYWREAHEERGGFDRQRSYLPSAGAPAAKDIFYH